MSRPSGSSLGAYARLLTALLADAHTSLSHDEYAVLTNVAIGRISPADADSFNDWLEELAATVAAEIKGIRGARGEADDGEADDDMRDLACRGRDRQTV